MHFYTILLATEARRVPGKAIGAAAAAPPKAAAAPNSNVKVVKARFWRCWRLEPVVAIWYWPTLWTSLFLLLDSSDLEHGFLFASMLSGMGTDHTVDPWIDPSLLASRPFDDAWRPAAYSIVLVASNWHCRYRAYRAPMGLARTSEDDEMQNIKKG